MTNLTAWLTTEGSALDQDNADVTVIGENGEIFGYFTTSIRHDGDAGEIEREAADRLYEIGFRKVGAWEAVVTGGVCPVEAL